MKFGRTENPGKIDFTLPNDHPDTTNILKQSHRLKNIYVGCAKWNKQELKNFYPKGIKDELAYYSSQFNCIELNATFYGYFKNEKLAEWASKVPDDFRFFPKVPRVVSHMKRLINIDEDVRSFEESLHFFHHKVEMCFLQLQENFSPENMERLKHFISIWPKKFPLAIELRNPEWFHDEEISSKLVALFKAYNITNVITDTAMFRELVHMRLTSTHAFVRYVGANHKTDYTRLDDWVLRLEKWVNNGLENIYFFVHQNEEKESPQLAEYFINRLRNTLKRDIQGPSNMTLDLF